MEFPRKRYERWGQSLVNRIQSHDLRSMKNANGKTLNENFHSRLFYISDKELEEIVRNGGRPFLIYKKISLFGHWNLYIKFRSRIELFMYLLLTVLVLGIFAFRLEAIFWVLVINLSFLGTSFEFRKEL
jgi:hypothetical protein